MACDRKDRELGDKAEGALKTAREGGNGVQLCVQCSDPMPKGECPHGHPQVAPPPEVAVQQVQQLLAAPQVQGVLQHQIGAVAVFSKAGKGYVLCQAGHGVNTYACGEEGVVECHAQTFSSYAAATNYFMAAAHGQGTTQHCPKCGKFMAPTGCEHCAAGVVAATPAQDEPAPAAAPPAPPAAPLPPLPVAPPVPATGDVPSWTTGECSKMVREALKYLGRFSSKSFPFSVQVGKGKHAGGVVIRPAHHTEFPPGEVALLRAAGLPASPTECVLPASDLLEVTDRLRRLRYVQQYISGYEADWIEGNQVLAARTADETVVYTGPGDCRLVAMRVGTMVKCVAWSDGKTFVKLYGSVAEAQQVMEAYRQAAQVPGVQAHCPTCGRFYNIATGCPHCQEVTDPIQAVLDAKVPGVRVVPLWGPGGGFAAQKAKGVVLLPVCASGPKFSAEQEQAIKTLFPHAVKGYGYDWDRWQVGTSDLQSLLAGAPPPAKPPASAPPATPAQVQQLQDAFAAVGMGGLTYESVAADGVRIKPPAGAYMFSQQQEALLTSLGCKIAPDDTATATVTVGPKVAATLQQNLQHIQWAQHAIQQGLPEPTPAVPASPLKQAALVTDAAACYCYVQRGSLLYTYSMNPEGQWGPPLVEPYGSDYEASGHLSEKAKMCLAGGGHLHCPVCGKFVSPHKPCQHCGAPAWGQGQVAPAPSSAVSPSAPAAVPPTPPAPQPPAAPVPSIEPMDATAALIAAIAPPVGKPVTPITPELPEQALAAGPNGTALLGGGDDVEDQTLTLYAYQDPAGGSRLILTCKVRADMPLQAGQSSAEAKLLDALALGETKYITVTEEEERFGRLPWDAEHQILENLVTAGKSLRHHFHPVAEEGEHGDGVVKPKVPTAIAAAKEALDELEASGKLTPVQEQMVAHYRAIIADLEDAIKTREAAGDDRSKWRKPEFVTEFKGSYTVQVQKKVPVLPDPDAAAQGFPTIKEGESLPAVQTGPEGQRLWTGERTKGSSGNFQYRVDLGNGWTAIYHPHNPEAHGVFALQGLLEIIPPSGQADAAAVAQAMSQLRRLNLHGYLGSGEDEEYLFLVRNAWALGLTNTAEFKGIMGGGEKEEARVQELLGQMVEGLDAEDVAGLDDMQQAVLAQDMLMRAQHQVKLERRERLRAMLAKKLGTTPENLLKSPQYLAGTQGRLMISGGQTPAGGFRVWHRLDANQTAQYKSRRVTHSLTGNGWDNLVACIRSGGVLLGNVRRQLGGIHAGGTLSPGEDMVTGGASYLFCRLQSHDTGDIVWEFHTLMQRSDWYAYPSDHFGQINLQSHHGMSGYTTDIGTASGYTGGTNEVMLKNGVSLVDYPPRAIRCPTAGTRSKVLAAFADVGITHLGGRPVTEIVQVIK